MAGIGQYLKDTRAELRHVAWPTRSQTIIYTVLVAALSVAVALYLGFFDFVFTTGLSRAISVLPQSNPITVTQQPASGQNVLVQGNPVTITDGTATSTQ